MTLVIKFQPGLRPIIKHLAGQHDQKTHGSWSQGITDEFNTWSPKDKVPPSPPNKGSVPAKAWDNWEHGPDGTQYTDLYRYYAGQMLGLKVPESPFLPGGWANYLTQRGFGGSSLETSKKHAEAMLKAIEKGTPQPTLWRGLTPSRNDEETQKLIEDFKNLKPGETIDMPLVSTTRSLGVATWYADARNSGAGDVPVVLKITGASGISRSPETSFYPADYEVITSGKFEVVDINKVSVTPWERNTVNIGISSDGKYAYANGRSMEEYRDSQGEVAPSIYKQFYEGYTTGNYKGLESDSKQFTQFRGQDIPPNENWEYGNQVYVHRWDKQPKKDFVVVELKLVEPHRVAKASTDYGLKFDGLLLGRVVDQTIEEEKLNKHLAGQHDQKTHGLWATGTPQGGNGLSHREIMNLQKTSSDSKKKAVYNAEGKNNPVNEPGPKPQIAERGFFASQADYDKAYKEYSKKFTDWAREFHRNIQSPTGEKHLNGKPKGVEDYVLAVTTSKWFVEAFGNGGRLGIPPVKVQSLANANGTYMVGIKNGQGVSALTIDSYSTRNEPTILHEIAHYATATSARESYEPHGVEFMKNFLYIGSKVIGDDWAAKLAKSYREEGIDLGN